jgi:hypothetical protein
MIERHYFRNKVFLSSERWTHFTDSIFSEQLVKSFDFEFGFCIPGSVNTWDAVYSVPALSDELRKFHVPLFVNLTDDFFSRGHARQPFRNSIR